MRLAEKFMQMKMTRILTPLTSLLLLAGLAYGGGDPQDTPQAPAVKREQVAAAPEETATAVRRARQAVSPAPATAPAVPMMATPAPQRSAPATSGADWALATSAGSCQPLENVRQQVANIGSFNTPQEFARQMQQRGHQTFALDIGKTRDQEVRVKIPDLNLDLLFLRSGLCR